MGTGRIIGGIILLVLGIIIFAASMFFYTVQTSNLEYCNSLLGGLQQGLDPGTVEQCSRAGAIRAGALGGMILGGALALVGLILVIVGTVQKGTKPLKTAHQQTDRISDNRPASNGSSRFAYCRYCGKERPIFGDHCPLCGRSSHSVSTNMKRCRACKATMSEDSKFCSNCSSEFETY